MTGSIKNNAQDTYATNLGIHYKIRRLYEEALKHNPHSLQLWAFYLKFEITYANCSNNRILHIYYQSIKDLPYNKHLYKLAVEYLPEKYNEIMTLLYNKEIRVYLPIQELNILLEPMKSRDEIGDDDNRDEKQMELGTYSSDEPESLSEETETDSSQDIVIGDNESGSDSESDASVEDLKDLDY